MSRPVGARCGNAARRGAPNAYPVAVATRPASILLAALALAVTPSAALAKPRHAVAKPGHALATPRHVVATRADVAATRSYIRANYDLIRTARSNLSVGVTALKGLVSQVAGECPLAAAESPQNHDSEQLSNEVVGAMTVVIYRPDAAAIHTFARAVAGLHWSNRKLTRIVKKYAAQLLGLAALATPDVCGDVRAWAASRYQTLAPSTVQFDTSYYADDIEAEEVPLRLLAPYESAAVSSLVHRTKRLEAPLAEVEAHGVYYYTRILNTLGLNP
jgi:hypothetical protein